MIFIQVIFGLFLLAILVVFFLRRLNKISVEKGLRVIGIAGLIFMLLLIGWANLHLIRWMVKHVEHFLHFNFETSEL